MMKRINRSFRILLALCVLVMAISLMLTVPASAAIAPTPVPVSGVTVTFIIQSDWGTGCIYNVTIKNNTAQAISGGWKLSWTFIGDQKLANVWSVTATQTGSDVVVTPGASYNSSIPANGGTFNFGFSVTGTGRGVTNVRFSGGGGVIW